MGRIEGGRGVGRDEGRVEGWKGGGCGPGPVYDELDRKTCRQSRNTTHRGIYRHNTYTDTQIDG